MVIFVIWLIRKKSKERKGQLYEPYKAAKKSTTVVAAPEFAIPYSLRTVQEQLPVVTYERDSNSGGSEPKNRKTSNGRRVGVSGSRPILPPEGVSDTYQNLDVSTCNLMGTLYSFTMY